MWKSGGKSMETPRPRCLCKIARAGGKNEHHWLLIKAGVLLKKKKKERKKKEKEERERKKGSTHCALLPFLSPVSTPSGLCTRLFPSIFLAIEEAACLRHRQMFIGRNTDVFSVLAAIFHPSPSSTSPSFSLSLSDFFYSSPSNRDHSSRPRNTSRPILLLVSSSPIIFLNQRSVESRRINGTSTRLCVCVRVFNVSL